MPITKTMPAFIKSIDEEKREVTQIVSVFGNVDHGGDKVIDGAFTRTLEEWKASDNVLSSYFSHQWDDPFANIGVVTAAEELHPGDERLPDTPIPGDPDGKSLRDLGGLMTTYKVDEGPAFAEQVWNLLKGRRITQASFAYDVKDSQRTENGITELLDLDLFEIGPTLLGMNSATTLLEAKARDIETAKAQEPDKKSIGSFAGSMEETQSVLHGLAESWANDANVAAGGLFMVELMATYEDHVIIRVEGWDDPLGGGKFYEASIETASEGERALGTPVEVALQLATTPKSHDPLRRAFADILKRAKADVALVGRQPEAGNGNGEASKGQKAEASTTESARRRLRRTQINFDLES